MKTHLTSSPPGFNHMRLTPSPLMSTILHGRNYYRKMHCVCVCTSTSATFHPVYSPVPQSQWMISSPVTTNHQPLQCSISVAGLWCRNNLTQLTWPECIKCDINDLAMWKDFKFVVKPHLSEWIHHNSMLSLDDFMDNLVDLILSTTHNVFETHKASNNS